jgi:phospholipid/cholesterol/gamma-HCH transport system substrate-binding protein
MAAAKRVRWAKLRVTGVSVAAVVILATLLFELFGGVLFSPKTLVYLYIPDASGLSGESPVRVDGIDVGRVSAVELSGSKDARRAVKVTLLFYRDRITGVPIDSVAQISSDSLIGDKFVDINGGKSPKNIPAEGELVYKDQPELLRSLDLTQFTQQLRLVDATLTDIEQGRSQFGKFYQGQDFYNNLMRKLTDLQKAFAAAVSTTGAVGSLMSTDKLHAQASSVLEELDRTIAKIQAGQGTAGQLLRSTGQYDQLLAKAQEFRQQLVDLGKNDLLRSDSAYTGANQTLLGLIQSVDELNRNPQMTNTILYDNLNGSMKELRDNLRDFRMNPRKYLRIKLF